MSNPEQGKQETGVDPMAHPGAQGNEGALQMGTPAADQPLGLLYRLERVCPWYVSRGQETREVEMPMPRYVNPFRCDTALLFQDAVKVINVTQYVFAISKGTQARVWMFDRVRKNMKNVLEVLFNTQTGYLDPTQGDSAQVVENLYLTARDATDAYDAMRRLLEDPNPFTGVALDDSEKAYRVRGGALATTPVGQMGWKAAVEDLTKPDHFHAADGSMPPALWHVQHALQEQAVNVNIPDYGTDIFADFVPLNPPQAPQAPEDSAENPIKLEEEEEKEPLSPVMCEFKDDQSEHLTDDEFGVAGYIPHAMRNRRAPSPTSTEVIQEGNFEGLTAWEEERYHELRRKHRLFAMMLDQHQQEHAMVDGASKIDVQTLYRYLELEDAVKTQEDFEKRRKQLRRAKSIKRRQATRAARRAAWKAEKKALEEMVASDAIARAPLRRNPIRKVRLTAAKAARKW